jgi:hypothetical protein
LHETYNFDASLSDNFLGNFKICSFKNGEIVTKDVLIEGLGLEKYEELVDGKILGDSSHQVEHSTFNKFQMQDNPFRDQGLEEDEQTEQNFDFNLNRADQRKAQLDSINLDPAAQELHNNQDMINQHFKNRVLLQVSIQLGIKSIPQEYYKTIVDLMRLKQFVGAVGGRPNLAYYFVGVQYPLNYEQLPAEEGGHGGSFASASALGSQGIKLVYLDPHIVQNSVQNIQKEYLERNMKGAVQFHCQEARVVDISYLDPSISFGYLINSYSEYLEFASQIEEINSKVSEDYRIITIQSEGLEQRVLNDLRTKGEQLGQDPSGILHSIITMHSDYIKE